jgi:predicted rRNA methylase YqxC with S4 and FtsJ domains
MNTAAKLKDTDAIQVTLTIDLSIAELRAVLEEMDQITHADRTPYWIFKGHLERLRDRVNTVVVSKSYEEPRLVRAE